MTEKPVFVHNDSVVGKIGLIERRHSCLRRPLPPCYLRGNIRLTHLEWHHRVSNEDLPRAAGHTKGGLHS